MQWATDYFVKYLLFFFLRSVVESIETSAGCILLSCARNFWRSLGCLFRISQIGNIFANCKEHKGKRKTIEGKTPNLEMHMTEGGKLF